MQITRQTEYAIHTILVLSGVPFGEFIQTKTISEQRQIPEVFLKKTVQALGRSGLVITQRGAQGGIRLARPSSEITLADVLVAIEGDLAINVCLDKSYECSNRAGCQVHRILKRTQEAMIRELTRETFADLVKSDS